MAGGPGRRRRVGEDRPTPCGYAADTPGGRCRDTLAPEDEETLIDTVGLMKQVIASTDKVVKGTEPSQLGLPSPCTEWTVRDVINHITGGSTVFAVCVEEGSVPDELLGQLMGGDNLGDDFVGAWEAASTRAVAAFESPGA